VKRPIGLLLSQSGGTDTSKNIPVTLEIITYKSILSIKAKGAPGGDALFEDSRLFEPYQIRPTSTVGLISGTANEACSTGFSAGGGGADGAGFSVRLRTSFPEELLVGPPDAGLVASGPGGGGQLPWGPLPFDVFIDGLSKNLETLTGVADMRLPELPSLL
jgi:hypothetical protein